MQSHMLLDIPRGFASIELTRTSDGCWLGRQAGDCGFNAFLGRPSFHPGPGKDRSRSVCKRWRFGARRVAYRQARALSLDLAEVLR